MHLSLKEKDFHSFHETFKCNKGALFCATLLPGLCSDAKLRHDFLDQHELLQITFKGGTLHFSVCAIAVAKVATKCRWVSKPDKLFIDFEIPNMGYGDITGPPSNSSWRAQLLVTANDRHRKYLWLITVRPVTASLSSVVIHCR